MTKWKLKLKEDKLDYLGRLLKRKVSIDEKVEFKYPESLKNASVLGKIIVLIGEDELEMTYLQIVKNITVEEVE